MTTREVASLILIGAGALVFMLVPKLRKHVAPSARQLLHAIVVPRLLLAYFLVLVASTASTAVSWRIGLWDWDLLKDAVILTAAVVLPMTFRSLSFKSGGELTQKLARETLGLSAIFAFYLDVAPLPLVGELVLQPVATILLVLQAVARTEAKWLPTKRLCDWLLGLTGVFLITWSTITLISSPPDWSELLRSLLFSFWVPLSLLPFFYVFGFYGVTDTVRARFRALRKPFTPRLMLAFMMGTQLRLSLLAQFNGRYNNVADATGFRDGLGRMRDFRKDLKRRDQEESERVTTLERNTGLSGIDNDGRHLDRREFDITKKRLDWIWTCQHGQFDRQGGRYWDHLTDLIVDAERNGLPADHGFVVETAKAGQVWRAWRRTPGGAVLGTGGAESQSQYYFQGDEPPNGWPGDSPDWIDNARDHRPADWNKSDGTRL